MRDQLTCDQRLIIVQAAKFIERNLDALSYALSGSTKGFFSGLPRTLLL